MLREVILSNMRLEGFKTVRRISVLAVIFVAIVTIVLYSGKTMDEYNEEQLRKNIDYVIEQNVETMTVTVEKHQNFVESMAKDLGGRTSDAKELQRIIHQRQKIKDVQHFLRIGFAYPDGSYYGSDGSVTNINSRDYFHKSLRGETVITGALLDKILPNTLINVISAPVRNDKNEIEGVVIETFLNSELTDILSRGYMAEMGSTAVVNQDGEIIAASTDSTLVVKDNDLLGYISVDSGNSRFQKVLEGKKTEYMYFNRDGGLHLYSAPLDLNGYVTKLYVAILVKQEYMQQQLAFYRSNILKMLAMVIMLIGIAFCYYFIDVRKQQQKQHKELEKVAYVDYITGGDNYPAFIRKMEKNPREGYFAMLTIGDFSVIQSSCGYKKADELLRKIHVQLKRIMRYGDELGHVNRADFVMFIATDDEAWLDRQIKLLNKYLAELAEAEETPALVAYLGMIKYAKGSDVRELINKSRVALMNVLENREEYYAIYGEKYTQDFLENSKLEKNFDRNIAEKRFEVWYQPKYDPFTNSIMGAEALIRLRDCDGKLIPPYKFIPLFESDGLIRHLDKYVFQTVCEMQKQRLNEGLSVVPVSINLSRVSLHYPHVVEEYMEIIQQVDLPTKYVPLEITESATVNNKDICKLLDHFCVHGFKLHMDDFGSGYSSLAALNVLPFSTMKIDKSIVDYIGEYSGNELIKHIVSLAKRLHMHVTVEGVETAEQVEFLKTINCHSIQGYYFSKPLEYKDFAERLDNEAVTVMSK